MKWVFWTAVALLAVREAEALKEPQLCYVLDGILFLYGIIVTFLYCRMKIQNRKKSKAPPVSDYEKVEGVYTGLKMREADEYMPLELRKQIPTEQPPEQGSLVG
nr:high affinity immunoglobulin epsilon receptor subunit gamma [Pogona vitticeps]